MNDRLGADKSAVQMQQGSMSIPIGIYFTGNKFSVAAWVYAFSDSPVNSRVIDCATAPGSYAATVIVCFLTQFFLIYLSPYLFTYIFTNISKDINKYSVVARFGVYVSKKGQLFVFLVGK